MNPAPQDLTDADLMRVAVYDESPANRSRAILAYGTRQMEAGMRAANMAHTFVVDAMLKVRK